MLSSHIVGSACIDIFQRLDRINLQATLTLHLLVQSELCSNCQCVAFSTTEKRRRHQDNNQDLSTDATLHCAVEQEHKQYLVLVRQYNHTCRTDLAAGCAGRPTANRKAGSFYLNEFVRL